MSFSEILDELARLSPQERLCVAERALALDVLSVQDEALVEQRLAEHHKTPGAAIPLDEFLDQVRTRYSL